MGEMNDGPGRAFVSPVVVLGASPRRQHVG